MTAKFIFDLTLGWVLGVRNWKETVALLKMMYNINKALRIIKNAEDKAARPSV